MPACPSGVRYDVLIEETRAELEKRARAAALDRLYREMVFALLPYPARLRVLRAAPALYDEAGLQWLVRARAACCGCCRGASRSWRR